MRSRIILYQKLELETRTTSSPYRQRHIYAHAVDLARLTASSWPAWPIAGALA